MPAKKKRAKVTRIPRQSREKVDKQANEATRGEVSATRHAKAPELATIADRLIVSPGLALGHLQGMKIAYEFTTQKSIGCNGFIAARLWPAWARPWGQYDFLVIAAKIQFDNAPERVREAAIAHALSHCEQTERGVATIAKHDYEDFGTVAKRYGAWSEGGRIVQLRLLEREGKDDAYSTLEQKSARDELARQASDERASGNGNGEKAAD